MPDATLEQPAAVLVAVQLPGVTDEELASELAELRRLAERAGLLERQTGQS